MTKKPNSSFCSMLWKHICVRPNFSSLPCCRYRTHTGSHFSKDINTRLDVNSDFFKNIRRQMIAGQPVSGCEECYDEEALTQESLRMKANAEWGTQFTNDQVTYDLIEYLEIFVGSTCNLKCIGCSPALSSSIREEFKENNWPLPFIYDPPADANIDFIENLANLKHLKFVGGEPIMNRLHDSIIATIRRRNLANMKLTYYTNCTVWPKPETISAWKETKRVDLNMSIDGVGERNEYLRKNSRWDKVDKIARQYFALAEEMPNLSLQVNVTVSMLNVLYLQEIEDWFAGLTKAYPKAHFEPVYMTYLTDPDPLAAHNAPLAMIDRVMQTYKEKGSQQQLKIANLLKTVSFAENPVGKEKFLSYVNRFDKTRNTSFGETFPELLEFFG